MLFHEDSELIQVTRIFCAEPWYNEPGRETRQMEEASQRYNVDMQSLTVSYALTEPLREFTKRRKDKHKAQRQHVWTDVIEKHFSVYGSEISAKLKDWLKKAEKLPARSMRRSVCQSALKCMTC